MSHPSRVRGLKHAALFEKFLKNLSHPSRVRGLKQSEESKVSRSFLVAPFTGAWIETKYSLAILRTSEGRTLHGCVD